MPTYRVISEPWPVGHPIKEDSRRRMRGDASVRRLVTTVDAPDFPAAVILAMVDSAHGSRNITSVEELVPAIALYVSDNELTDLLRQENDAEHDQEPLHPADYEADETIFGSADFNGTVELVAAKLGESFLPGLFLTVVDDLDGAHALIQIRDEATGTYLAKTADMDDLIQDAEAPGWSAILSIASAILYQAQELV